MRSAVRWVIAGLLVAFGAALLPGRAHAGAYTYSTTRRVFKVGILIIDSTEFDFRTPVPTRLPGGPENTAPYLFYLADARTDVKPLNWEFINPLAPKTVTAEVRDRWVTRDPGRPYTLGQNVNKNMAAYWEVFLSRASLDELLQFDLLFIANHRDTKFSGVEREKLRKLVDAGGIIWIEDSAGMRIRPDGPFFLDELQFRGGGGSPADAGPEIYAPNHPLLNTPYRLSIQEIANLGDKNYGDYYISAFTDAELQNSTQPINRGTEGTEPPNPEVLINIIGNRAAPQYGGQNGLHLPYVAAGNYGSGAVIATAGDIGDDINIPVGGTVRANRGAFSGENLQAASTGDLKFVYNLVAWGGANNTERRNARRSASTFEAVGAPLLARFDFTAPRFPADVVASQSAPLIVKNILFVSGVQGGNGTLRAYDTQPYRDVDNDGNPDDGGADLIFGTTYDEIWRADLGAVGGGGGGAAQVLPSSPTYATVVNAAGEALEVIFVTLPDGRLQAYQAFPNTGGRLAAAGNLLYTTQAPQANGDYRPGPTPSPVFYEGRVYVTEPDGLIRCVNAVDGNTLWTSFDRATPPPATLVPTGPATVGFTRLQAGATGSVGSKSGGNTLDLMLYQPVQEGTDVGRILPYWLGARNEVMDAPSNPATWVYFTRIASSNGRYYVARGPRTPGPPAGGDGPFITPVARVYQEEPNATPPRTARQNYEAGRVSEVYTARFLTVADAPPASGGPLGGRVQIVDAGGNPPPAPTTQEDRDNFIVAADYDILYVPAPGGYPKPPNLNGDGSRDIGRVLRIAGGYGSGLETVALSPDDLLIYSALETATGGSGPGLSAIYATNEQTFGQGATKTRWRFTLHGGSGAGNVQVDGASFIERAPLQNALTFHPNWPEISQVVAGEPAALENVVAAGAPITTNDGISYVLAGAASANGPVTVLMAFRTNQTVTLNVGPMQQSPPPVVKQLDAASGNIVQLQPNQYTADYARGRITITNFQSTGNAASASQSFVVTATPAGQAAPVTQVHAPLNSTFGDDFTPLLWYYVLPGAPRSSPTLIGDYIYFNQVRGGTTAITAVDANPGLNDPTVKRGQQIINVAATLNNEPQKLNHVRWNQPLVGSVNGQPAPVNGLAAPVGAQGTLVVNTDQGPFAFEDAITLVADAKRVIEARADGSAVWALDSTVKQKVAGGEAPVYIPDPANPGGDPILANPGATGRVVEERKSISKPSTARRLSPADLLIADTGNNRVVRVDRAGKVLWDLEKINDIYKILASGDPVTLNNPTDVQFWTVYNYGPQGQVIGYEAHYLVADAGNFRLVEVVDFYDAQGRVRNVPVPGGPDQPGERVLIWTTRTGSREGRRLRYQSVERFVIQEQNTGNRLPVIVAVVGNIRATGTDATATSDFTGGALVQVTYRPFNTVFYNATGAALPPLWPPPAGANPVISTEPADNGLIGSSIDDLVMPDGVTVKRITRPLYFQQLTLPNPAGGERRVYLVCDAEGVYEIEPRQVGNRIVRQVIWYFTQEDYNAMNATAPVAGGAPRLAGASAAAQLPRFLPSSVRRLPSGNYLITNSFTGASPAFESGQFLGEVFEVDPDPYRNAARGFHGGDFAGFSVPRIIARTSDNGNIIGYRQQMGDAGNTSILEQPLFSDRLF